MDQEDLSKASPISARKIFRSGKLRKQQTSGICPGFLQANIVIIHSEYVEDFRKFVDLNSAPCPLLYQSKVGEVSAPFLANGSDIRYL